jgi:hypothetical protein
MTFSAPRWSIRAIAALLSLCVLSLVAVSPAGARDQYPNSVQKAFNKACVKAATKKGTVTKKQAKAYCRNVFVCIESKMTLKQFKNAAIKDSGKSSKKINKCEKQARKSIS